jgi:hypothetical protein
MRSEVSVCAPSISIETEHPLFDVDFCSPYCREALMRATPEDLMRQFRPILVSLIAALAAQLVPATGFAQGTQSAEVPIPFTRHVLDNGLTLLVHEDHKAPIVAVNVWYHVGSKNEPTGRTGFAHLFEHLMFNGSEHVDTDYFEVLEPLGATDLNGTTNMDRTNYFQNVPTSAVDLALWMESDRMGHLLGAVDQERLDEQRGVVQYVPCRTSVLTFGHWLDGGPRRGESRGRTRVVPDVLRTAERGPGHRR